MPRPAAEMEGCCTKNIMKRICAITLFTLLLASCTPAQNATPTSQAGQLTLDMQPACKDLINGLCVVSEPGEWLGGGQTLVLNGNPQASFIYESTLQVKMGDWTLVFNPGENTPFSVGMTYPNASLYPAGGYLPSMTVENNGKKCDEVEGIFTDDILQAAQQGNQQINPVTSFDIRFAMRCNKQHQVIRGRVKLSQS